jgi:hypothetical protein
LNRYALGSRATTVSSPPKPPLGSKFKVSTVTASTSPSGQLFKWSRSAATSLLRLRNVPLTGGELRCPGSMRRRLVPSEGGSLTVSLGEAPSKGGTAYI